MFLEADKFHLFFQKILGSSGSSRELVGSWGWWCLSDFQGNLQRAVPTQSYLLVQGLHLVTAELSKDTSDILYFCGEHVHWSTGESAWNSSEAEWGGQEWGCGSTAGTAVSLWVSHSCLSRLCSGKNISFSFPLFLLTITHLLPSNKETTQIKCTTQQKLPSLLKILGCDLCPGILEGSRGGNKRPSYEYFRYPGWGKKAKEQGNLVETWKKLRLRITCWGV